VAKKVLVVDDDPDVTLYLSSFLDDHGYEVRCANSADAALAALDGLKPDVILVDVLMPGRSGLDLLLTLRRQPRWSAVMLVVMTGMDQILQDDCNSYLGPHRDVRGPDAVLGKPLDPPTLLRVLAKLTADTPTPA
jgi:CheY-like chemotaxis protein